MADVGEKAAQQLTEITECPICMSDFTDPRMLPCIHTFCFECLKRTGAEAQMKPGDKMPCPLCRKEFIIPVEGMNGVEKNFFMGNLLDFKTTLQKETDAIILCDHCLNNDGQTGEIPKGLKRCLDCQCNYCDGCVKIHQFAIMTRNHRMVRIGSDYMASGMKSGFSGIWCTRHTNKPLDCYCFDCKKIACVACLVENHKSHKCKAVTGVYEEFRQAIEKKAWLISNYSDELMLIRENMEKRKVKYLNDLVESENSIIHGNNQLRDLIDHDTKSLLDELSVIKSNHCRALTAVYEEFRQANEKKEWLIPNYSDELMLMRENSEKRKAEFLKDMVQCEDSIIRRSNQLRDLIDRDTKSLLDELSAIKSTHLKQLVCEMEEIDRSCTKLKSFEAYCTELRSKGSASDICSSVDQLLARADDLERDHEAIMGRAHQSIEISFQSADFLEASQKSDKNLMGEIHAQETTSSMFENYAIVVGLNDASTVKKDVIKVNLLRSEEIPTQEQIMGLPTTMQYASVAAVCYSQMYVTGVGDNRDEIWKYSFISGWMKCASLVQGRRRHSAAFIDEVLYICGGFVDSIENVLDSVEAYNAITDKCAIVGKLVQCVQNSGNCVPFKNSLYVFGGSDKGNYALNCVQVYNTKTNTCSVLSKPMPQPYKFMRAVLWKTCAILVGRDTCFIFNFETGEWEERKHFKTDVHHFGLLLEYDNVFVIGGGDWKTDNDGKAKWTSMDDVRYVPLQNIINDKPIEWKLHGKLPRPALVQAHANMRILT